MADDANSSARALSVAQSDFAKVGFIGLGVMGQPMAANLLGAGRRLLAWNRSAPALETIKARGASVATSPAAVFAGAHAVTRP